MPRNLLKSFPTAMLRRGLAHVHPACIAPVVPVAPPPDLQPVRLTGIPTDPSPDSPATLLLIVTEPPDGVPVAAEAELACAA